MKGNRLRELRIKNGYSQEEIAEEILVTKYIIDGWEKGYAAMKPSSGEIGGMAELFHMSEEELREVLDHPEEEDYDYDR